MASLLQQAIAAMVTKLDAAGKPANVVVARSRALVGDLANDPDTIGIVVKPGKEVVTTHGTRPDARIAERVSMVMTEISVAAADGESWDQTADPVKSWIVSQLLADPTLGGMVKNVEEKESIWEDAEIRGEREAGRFHTLWAVHHYTKANNQEAKP